MADARGNETPEQTAQRLAGDRQSHEHARANATPEHTANRQDNEMNRQRASRAITQGPLTACMPEYMVEDAYLATFERNIYAAQALFWARSYIWQFAEYRDFDFADLDESEYDRLHEAITEEGKVKSQDIERCMRMYLRRMDPTKSPIGCGCCGMMDVPVAQNLNDNQQETARELRSFVISFSFIKR
jgi:hypothetical protein